MLNFEIKTKISNPSKTLNKLRKIGVVYKNTMNQVDYYFKVGTYKEKIREIDKKTIQLISYKRLEKKGKKNSNYIIKKLSLKQKNNLLKQKPLLCVVNKTRELWIYKHTRIHFDNVVNLGSFLEIETVVKNISKKRGLDEFKKIVNLLKINLKRTEEHSYSDLILNNEKQRN
jgi:predicted adenylyl cyclase CyaB